jgi:hypothetical protein
MILILRKQEVLKEEATQEVVEACRKLMLLM